LAGLSFSLLSIGSGSAEGNTYERVVDAMSNVSVEYSKSRTPGGMVVNCLAIVLRVVPLLAW
jgi:hypothetical protein